MQKVFCLVFVILVSGLLGVDSLQCYSCGNCAKPTDADLVTCGASGSTVAPPGTTVAPPGTTVAPPGTTVAPPETTVAPPGTTVAPPETTVAAPGTTVAPPETTVAPPGTTVAPPETTVAPPGTTVAPSETTVAPPGTTVAPPETNVAPPKNKDDVAPGSRTKRSILSLTNTNSDGCKCKDETGCKCAEKLIPDRISQYEDIPYACYKAADNDIIYRGCIPASIGCNFTEFANATSCKICDTDKCNGSSTIYYSAVMLVATVLLLLVK